MMRPNSFEAYRYLFDLSGDLSRVVMFTLFSTRGIQKTPQIA